MAHRQLKKATLKRMSLRLCLKKQKKYLEPLLSLAVILSYVKCNTSLTLEIQFGYGVKGLAVINRQLKGETSEWMSLGLHQQKHNSAAILNPAVNFSYINRNKLLILYLQLRHLASVPPALTMQRCKAIREVLTCHLAKKR
jgi:hypothetical protein